MPASIAKGINRIEIKLDQPLPCSENGRRLDNLEKVVSEDHGPRIDEGESWRDKWTGRVLILGPSLFIIATAEEPTLKPYSGPYQGKLELGPEEIEFIAERDGMALSEVLTTLRSLSSNVGTLASEVKILRWAIPCIITIGIAVIAILVSLD